MWYHVTISSCLFIALSAVCVQSSNKPFHGHKVLRIKPTSYEQVKTLTDLEHDLKLDFWHLPHVDNDHMDVRVAPKFAKHLNNTLQRLKLDFEELIDDVQILVDRETKSNRKRRAIRELQDYTKHFLSYNEINAFLFQIANVVPTAELININKTNELRDTYVIKLGTPMGRWKPAIFIDAGIHAREWIAPATAINFIYQLAINPTRDAQITDLLRKFDFYIAPLVNADGYEHSRSSVNNRLWRKNRRRASNSRCIGVDINRNFGYEWNPAAGGSNQPCSDLFSGAYKFSEPESRNLRNFMLSKKPDIKGYLTLHSYGLYWLYPWGFSDTETAVDDNKLRAIARTSVNAMSKQYTIGASAKVLYVAAGGSDDYAKAVAGIPYSYTVELPPSSGAFNGFILSESKIADIAQDTLKGLKAYAYSINDYITPTTTTTTTSAAPSYYWGPYHRWWQSYFG
ncbi:carboxypeptidase B [Patella vulgata]|uniref:carboxypeptidase B n=1 Tax=Patella vulgata TaxID=6465 RepID=UPI00217F7F27|nr:carboxypeptidase B [Patella vulgata]XP_050397809.1 carboxypeptidase B [Patella vulgata]